MNTIGVGALGSGPLACLVGVWVYLMCVSAFHLVFLLLFFGLPSGCERPSKAWIVAVIWFSIRQSACAALPEPPLSVGMYVLDRRRK